MTSGRNAQRQDIVAKTTADMNRGQRRWLRASNMPIHFRAADISLHAGNISSLGPVIAQLISAGNPLFWRPLLLFPRLRVSQNSHNGRQLRNRRKLAPNGIFIHEMCLGPARHGATPYCSPRRCNRPQEDQCATPRGYGKASHVTTTSSR